MSTETPVVKVEESDKASDADRPQPIVDLDLFGVGTHYKRGRLYSEDFSVVDPDCVVTPVIDTQLANTHLEMLCELNIFTPTHAVRNTGIICTIGPSCQDVDTLEKLIRSGMCIARLNFSHGTHQYHAQSIASIREAVSRVPDKCVAIALDIQGLKIRTGLLKGGGNAEVELFTGNILDLSIDEKYMEIGDEHCVYVDYPSIVECMNIGDSVYIDDGLMSAKVVEKGPTHVRTVIQNGGLLGSRKGINLPGKLINLPAMSEKDKEDFKFGCEQGVDMIFASFVRKAADIEEMRKELGEEGKDILIVSKIENEEGMRNFDEILRASDGIMVARGDLGIEIPVEKVFLAQKMMVSRCNRAGKPVIVATQMLESMVYKPRPTRAEASDVANAVLDGADCVMLSGETAKGKYPVEVVNLMHKVCLEAEAAMFHRVVFEEIRRLTPKPTNTATTAAIAAVDASFQQNAAAIVTLTTTGRTAFILAKYRPRCPIIAVTRDPRTARICHLHRSIHPVVYADPLDVNDWTNDMERRFAAAIAKGKRDGYIRKGSTIVVLSGWKPGPTNTNTIRICQVEY
ncbi:hypothetical protein EMCRGX_G030662 [Ephydatia muelleri]